MLEVEGGDDTGVGAPPAGAAAWSMGEAALVVLRSGGGGWIPEARRRIDPGASRWRPEVQGY
jgi:hypothetical protein